MNEFEFEIEVYKNALKKSCHHIPFTPCWRLDCSKCSNKKSDFSKKISAKCWQEVFLNEAKKSLQRKKKD